MGNLWYPRRLATIRSSHSQELLTEFDRLIWVGVLALVLGTRLNSGTLGFVVVLTANFRYLGLAGWIISGSTGWKKRLILMVFLEISLASASGMFHELILWSLSLMAVFAFLSEMKAFALICWLGLLAFGVFALQDAKWTIREAAWGGASQVSVFGTVLTYNRWSAPFVSTACVLDSATKWVRNGYADQSIADAITRFNQGWIVGRVLQHVPENEPFARGNTIVRSIKACFLPRFLAPDKAIAGGRENMERYAGLTLTESTSMNIGFAGELYANYGRWGGAMGCGIYGLLLASLFRWTALRAQTSPLWWAVLIYCGHWALKAEDDIAGVLNYLVKASIMLVLALAFLPGFRGELRKGLTQSRL